MHRVLLEKKVKNLFSVSSCKHRKLERKGKLHEVSSTVIFAEHRCYSVLIEMFKTKKPTTIATATAYRVVLIQFHSNDPESWKHIHEIHVTAWKYRRAVRLDALTRQYDYVCGRVKDVH